MKENTYQREKEIIVTIISMVLILGLYSIYIYNKYISETVDIFNDYKFWGKTFLILIPVTIVSQIVIHIIFAIINKIVTDEETPAISDERDKLINLRAIKVSHSIFTFGFSLAMGSLAFGMPPCVIFISLILFGFIAAIISEIAKIYFYRKGF